MLITNLTHFLNVFISLLYMFWATQCSSSGESIVSIHHLVCITPCRWPSGMQVREESSSLTCLLDDQPHWVIHTRWCIDTSDSSDDEHWVTWNMYRSEINTLKKCFKLVINMKWISQSACLMDFSCTSVWNALSYISCCTNTYYIKITCQITTKIYCQYILFITTCFGWPDHFQGGGHRIKTLNYPHIRRNLFLIQKKI